MFDRADVIYRWDGSLPGLLCCVFETWRARRAPLDIWEAEDPRVSLMPELAVPREREKAARVWRRLLELSPEAAQWTEEAFLSGEEDRAIALHDFLCEAFRLGRSVTARLGEPAVARAYRLSRQVSGEAHRLLEFVRFEEHHGVLAARIEPHAFVLPLMAGHFAGRFPGEDFLIHDISHGAALLHHGGRCSIRPLEELALGPPTLEEAQFQALWRRYYDAIAIRERLNPKCRMTHCPKRFWKHMPELGDPSSAGRGLESGGPARALAGAVKDGPFLPGGGGGGHPGAGAIDISGQVVYDFSGTA